MVGRRVTRRLWHLTGLLCEFFLTPFIFDAAVQRFFRSVSELRSLVAIDSGWIRREAAADGRDCHSGTGDARFEARPSDVCAAVHVLNTRGVLLDIHNHPIALSHIDRIRVERPAI